jgi:hypothetical protein
MYSFEDWKVSEEGSCGSAHRVSTEDSLHIGYDWSAVNTVSVVTPRGLAIRHEVTFMLLLIVYCIVKCSYLVVGCSSVIAAVVLACGGSRCYSDPHGTGQCTFQ